MNISAHTPEVVFLLTLVATYSASIYAKFKASASDEDLAGRDLNKWLIGLSAATTGNSGFIVTAAVSLGYTGGMQWMLMPLGWLVGDLVFWRIFPGKINHYGRRSEATTLPQILVSERRGVCSYLILFIASAILAFCLSGYTASQWLAGEKFMSGAFGWSGEAALVLFGLLIVGYSTIGGFRGSVYVDVVQAFFRIAGTIVALLSAMILALRKPDAFWANLPHGGAEFLQIFPNGVTSGLIFALGFSFLSLGFGLGQPQIISRYMAGRDEMETQGAKWIYISFIQFTWLAMTLFGVVLRGVVPQMPDAEQGLSIFFRDQVGGVLAGIVFADVFATIASTSNGIIVAISQIIRLDMLNVNQRQRQKTTQNIFVTGAVGLSTVLIAVWLPSSVFELAVDSVAIIGAALAGPVAIKILGWPCHDRSILAAIVGGSCAAVLWKLSPLGSSFNEAGIGMVVGVLANRTVWALTKERR